MNTTLPRRFVLLALFALAAPFGACDEALDEAPPDTSTALGDAPVGAWPSPPAPVPEGTPPCRYDAHAWRCLVEVVGPGYLVVALGDGGVAYRRHVYARWHGVEGLLDEGDRGLLGFATDEAGALSADLSPIAFPAQSPPAATRTPTILVNLDSQADAQDADRFSVDDPFTESSFSTTATVYDSLGGTHMVELYFTRVGDGAWVWHLVTDGEEIAGGVSAQPVLLTSGALTFDTDGFLVAETGAPAEVTFRGAAVQSLHVTFGYTGDGRGSTSYAGSSSLAFLAQDGRPPGWLTDLSLAGGTIRAQYSNGEERVLGHLAVALFESPSLMQPLGAGLWVETEGSGPPHFTRSGAFAGVHVMAWSRDGE